MVPKQQQRQRQLMNQNKSKTGRRKKTKQNKKQEERSSQRCMRESVGETGNRSPGEMGLPPQSSEERGVFASRRVIHLVSRLGAGPLGTVRRCLITAFNQPSPCAGNTWGPQLGIQSRPAPRANGVSGGCTETSGNGCGQGEVIKSSVSLG